MTLLHSIILGHGDPLLILHGLFGMGDNWKTLANKFAEENQVHLIDQRNHGRSFHSKDFNYQLMVEDLRNYMNYHNLEKINLIGHSMGGKTAMLFAVNYPELIGKLIIVDITPKYYPPHHELILKALKSVNFSNMRSRNDIDNLFKSHISELGIRQFLLKNVYRKSKDKFAYRFNLDSLIENIEYIGEGLPNQSEYLGETLFLKGENSRYISTNDVGLIQLHFPNSEIISIPNSGHWLHAENPSEFYNNVVKFLKNH